MKSHTHYISSILFTLCAVFLLSAPVHAAVRTMDVTFTLVDEFGQPIQRTPSVSLHGCDVESLRTKPQSDTSENHFITSITFDHLQEHQVCSVSVGAQGFVTSQPINMGNISSGETRTLPNITLLHALAVTLRNNKAGKMPIMDAYFAGESPRYKVGDTLYFAPKNKKGSLDVKHDAYTLTSQTQQELQNITLSSETQKNIVLSGDGSCIVNDKNISCPGFTPTTLISVQDDQTVPLYDGSIKFYTDPAYTTFAQTFEANTSDASKLVEGKTTAFPLKPGDYYVKVSKVGYNDVHSQLTIPKQQTIQHIITLPKEIPSITSPQRSVLSASKLSAKANNIDAITLTVQARGSDSTQLRGRAVEFISSRGDIDAIIYPNGTQTLANGSLNAYLTSQYAGKSVVSVKIDGVVVSRFVTVSFEGDESPLVSQKQSWVYTTPSPVLADGKDSITLTLYVKNGAGTPLAQTPFNITSSRPTTDKISCDAEKTVENGTGSCTFTSTLAGTTLLTITAQNVIIDEIAVSVSPQVQ